MRPDYQRLATRIEGRVTLGATMKQYTTWKIGGPADCLAEPASADDVAAILAFAKEEGVPVFVFGNGSNLLVKDGGIEGIAIRVGHHCAQPVHRHFGVYASNRASSGIYNSVEDAQALIEALGKVRPFFGVE